MKLLISLYLFLIALPHFFHFQPDDTNVLLAVVGVVVVVVVVAVIVEASSPKVYARVTLASASTLSGSVVRRMTFKYVLPSCVEPGAPP